MNDTRLVIKQVQVDDVAQGHVAHGTHLFLGFSAEELLGWKIFETLKNLRTGKSTFLNLS